MGHDIYAGAVIDNSNEILQHLWLPAFHNENKAIYIALDAMDCYAHESGRGEVRHYTRQQIADAIAKLASGTISVGPDPTCEQAAKNFKAMLAEHSDNLVDLHPQTDVTFSKQRDFLNNTLEAMDRHQKTDVTIIFT